MPKTNANESPGDTPTPRAASGARIVKHVAVISSLFSDKDEKNDSADKKELRQRTIIDGRDVRFHLPAGEGELTEGQTSLLEVGSSAVTRNSLLPSDHHKKQFFRLRPKGVATSALSDCLGPVADNYVDSAGSHSHSQSALSLGLSRAEAKKLSASVVSVPSSSQSHSKGPSSDHPNIEQDLAAVSLGKSTPAMLIPGSTDKFTLGASFSNHNVGSHASSSGSDSGGFGSTTLIASQQSVNPISFNSKPTQQSHSAFSSESIHNQALVLPPARNPIASPVSNHQHASFASQHPQQRPITFDTNAFMRRKSNAMDSSPSSSIPPSSDFISSQAHSNLKRREPKIELDHAPATVAVKQHHPDIYEISKIEHFGAIEDPVSESDSDSDSENDEGQVFRASVSIRIPEVVDNSKATLNTPSQCTSPSRSALKQTLAKSPVVVTSPTQENSTLSSAFDSTTNGSSTSSKNGALSPHHHQKSFPKLRASGSKDVLGSPRSATTALSTASPIGGRASWTEAVGIVRKPSYTGLGSRASFAGSPLYNGSGFGGGSSLGATGVAIGRASTGGVGRNSSLGDVTSLLRHATASANAQQQLQNASHNSSQDSSGAFSPVSAGGGQTGSFVGSWKFSAGAGSVGSFQRTLSGVSIKRKDSTISSNSMAAAAAAMNSYSSGSYVAPSPAMSYLSMLAEKLDEPPRGVYYEGDQIGDWVLGKEIGHGSFSRVFEASPAAESVLSDMLSLSTRVAVKIVAKKCDDDSTSSLAGTPLHGTGRGSTSDASLASSRSSYASDSPSVASAYAGGNVNGRDSVADCGAGQDDVRRLLDHEIAIWSGLEHPNVLGMVQMMDVDDAVFIVSELAQGGNLLDHLAKKGRMSETTAKRVFKQSAEALRYLHCIAGIVHRDIKCENILLMEAGPPEDLPPAQPSFGGWGTPAASPDWIPTVKLADFGLSERLHIQNEPTPLDSIESLTTSTNPPAPDPIFCIGSLHYCAPEELKSTIAVNPAGDVWSLGCVLYTMLTASLPFNDEFLPRLQLSIMEGRYDESKLARAGVSDDGRAVIQGMLNVDVEKRWTIAQVCESDYFAEC
ncbi:hypothetical protein BJ741DRAFT_624561 [Chytriomyces cf. hyalinus JEL632]|nr:hypothetical protein BJ741DRAFT_624561 [Chytriomyces cf. hyalinus JEL632]